MKESSTVVGVNDGVEVTRLTLSYRKPAYSVERRGTSQESAVDSRQLAEGGPDSEKAG